MWRTYAVALAVGCSAPLEAPLELDVVAPRDIRHGRLVFSADVPLTLRFEEPPTDLEVELDVDGRWTVGTESERLRVGRRTIIRYQFDIQPVVNGVLEVRSAGQVARLDVQFVHARDRHPSVVDARDRRAAGDLDGARQLLARDGETLDAVGRMWADAERARILSASGDESGAYAAMKKAALGAAALGYRHDASRLWTIAAYYAHAMRRYDEMQDAITHAESLADGGEYWLAIAAFYRGLLARALGQYGPARRWFRRALTRATAVGAESTGTVVNNMLTELELELGLPQADARREGALWQDRKFSLWLDLVAMERCVRRPDWSQIRSRHASVRATAPPDLIDRERADLELERAVGAWLDGDVDTSVRALARARRLHPSAGFDPEMADRLEGELLTATGQLDAAITQLSATVRRAREHEDLRNAWPALHLLGRALRAQGDTDGALARYEAADRSAVQLSRTAALHGGRSALLGRRDALVADIVSLLVDAGDVVGAFEAVERHRAPVLRQIHADALLERPPVGWAKSVERWQRTRAEVRELRETCASTALSTVPVCNERLEQARGRAREALAAATALLGNTPEPEVAAASVLAKLRPGEAVVAFHPRVERRTCAVSWHGFLLADARVEYLSPAASPDDWAARLVGRTHVYVVDGGPEFAVPGRSSRIPWAGWLLRETEPADGPPVVVADPKRDLPHSASAARDVAAQTDATLLDGAAATRQRFIDAARRARWVHYDGHGVLDPDDPWEAHLPLADGRLAITEVLAAPMRPRTVVLAGCETALATDLGGRERVSLAHAFLLAGAHSVVATDRKIPDAESARFVRLFHALGGAETPGPAFEKAVGQLKRVGDPAWQGWRLFGRP